MTILASPTFENANFRFVANGISALHRLIKQGKEESSEAESIRDSLDGPLCALSQTEKDRIQWLSEDLYSVSEPSSPKPPKERNPQVEPKLIEAFQARQQRQWDRSLQLLRRWRDYISPPLLSYLRGSIWYDVGLPDVAAMFYGHASELDPSNANYKALYVHALSESNPTAAAEIARKLLQDHEHQAPVVVAHAANVIFHQTRTLSTMELIRQIQELAPVLQASAVRIEQDEETASRASAYAMTVGLLGFCFEFLGDVDAAVKQYTKGLDLNPDNDALLVARGMLLYGSSPRAIGDFERAVKCRSPLIWPYLFLAHHDLLTKQFDRCLEMCRVGTSMDGPETAKSHLKEWQAIAQLELQFPPELVRAAFEEAVRLDPSNEIAKRNQKLFETALESVPPRHPDWDSRSPAALKQFGLKEFDLYHRRFNVAA